MGITLIAAFLIGSFQLATAGVAHVILAFCYIGILIAGLGFLLDRPQLIYAYCAIALIAQVPFSVDLVRIYFGYEQLIGLVTYDPLSHSLFGRIVDFGVHVFVLPFVLFSLRYVEPVRMPSFVRWYVPLLVVGLGVSLVADVNCARIGCFEPLAYGMTAWGHYAYLSIIVIFGPLLAAWGLWRIHDR